MNTTTDKPTNTMNTNMSKEDWIILRLIREAIRAQPFSAPDHLKAISYLSKKYGRKQLDACIDQLNAEKQGAAK